MKAIAHQTIGFYPGYRTINQIGYWDEATRKVVLERLNQSSVLRFFTAAEAPLAQAVVDRVLPQDDRPPEQRIPVLAGIDERLYSGRIDGFRYEDMPPDGDAYRQGLVGIDEIAQVLFGREFPRLTHLQQDSVLLTLHDAKPPEAAPTWRHLPADRFWRLLIDDVVGVYYAHPWAWDEIGYGGPAYPRGYMRLDHGEPEPWEVEERRYEFEAPADSLSGAFTPLGKLKRGAKS